MNKAWKTILLKDLTTKIGSGATPKGGNDSYKAEGISLIRSLNVYDLEFKKDKLAYIDDAQATKLSNVVVEESDVLFNITGASIARCCVVPKGVLPARVNQHVAILRAADTKLDSHFLCYLMISPDYKDLLLKIGDEGGSTRQAITKAQLQELPIALPPIDEQKRIVKILDSTFASIDKAIENTEKNLANADTLVDRFLSSIIDTDCNEHQQKKLSAIATFTSGGTPSKNIGEYWGGEIPWVSGRDMKSTQLNNSALHLTQAAIEKTPARLAPKGTILILVRGMGLAHGAQITELLKPATFNQDIKGIHLHEGHASRFMVFALRHRINSSDNIISSAAHGTLKINMDTLQEVLIPCPPEAIQKIFVERINKLLNNTKQLKTSYRKKLEALQELKQSILQKAFTGQLTADFNKDEEAT